MKKQIKFATRPSALARWQTQFIANQLEVHWADLTCDEIVITTKGDRVIDRALPEIGGKGLFTSELEQALLKGEVDAAVHSLKDLPTEDTPGLIIGMIPERADERDVLICPAGYSLDELPSGSVIGTSSLRRQAQLLAYRPDLIAKSIRGNVDTRIRKVVDGEYDAIVLAAAGVQRLGLDEHITQYLPPEIMLPAPGQGALAVQCRAGDEETITILKALHHIPTLLGVTAERAFLSALGGGCSLPVGTRTIVDNGTLRLSAIVASNNGDQVLQLSDTRSNIKSSDQAFLMGKELAEKAISQGAQGLLYPGGGQK